MSSLVVADDAGDGPATGCWRRCVNTRWKSWPNAARPAAVRARRRNYYAALAAALDGPAGDDYEQRIERVEAEIDNLRAAWWSRENSDVELSLALEASLQPLWYTRRRIREALSWFDAALADDDTQHAEVAPAVRARALADSAPLGLMAGAADSLDRAEQALAMSRGVDDPALLVRALAARGYVAFYFGLGADRDYLGEAIGFTRTLGDRWMLTQILGLQKRSRGGVAGALVTMRAAAEEDAISPTRSAIDLTRNSSASPSESSGQLFFKATDHAVARFAALVAETRAAHGDNPYGKAASLACLGIALAYRRSDTGAARATAHEAIEAAAELGGLREGVAYWVLAIAALAGGDLDTARRAERGGRTTGTAAGGGDHARQCCAGRAGRWGSGRGPPLRRRRRGGGAGCLADALCAARPGGDRAG